MTNDSADCIFCKIIKREIPSKPVLEGDEFIAIADLNPQAPTHVLVMPKKHFANIKEVTDAGELGRLYQAAVKVAEKEGLGKGFRLVANTGDDGGQTVHHLHIHVLGGRFMGWPPG
jgi:histidine triad (HIT) family protein